MAFSEGLKCGHDQWCINVHKVQSIIGQVHEHSQDEIQQSQVIPKVNTNQSGLPVPNRQECSRVSLYGNHLQTMRPMRKLSCIHLGPATVIQWICSYADVLDLRTSVGIHRQQLGSLWDPMASDPLEGHWIDPMPTILVDGKEESHVSCIDDSDLYQDQLHYLIRWVGSDSLTWDLVKYVDGSQGVREFYQH